jgi:Glutamine amidotransferase domain
VCGIAGAVDEMPERAAARARLLNAQQAHRGPRVGAITLGNTRLAIQDPTPAGNQPFVSADGRYTCIFNGEIYNHRELTERLRLLVRTACDGEVIPQLWAKLGASPLAELRGMFAIALADGPADRLYLVRDPFGIKPLYWRLLPDGSLVFASEVRPLARLAPRPRVDDAAVAAAGRRLDRDLHCLTVATDVASDETGESARTARHYRHQFQQVPAALEDGDVAGFFQAMQRPSVDGLNTYLIRRAVHEAGKAAIGAALGDRYLEALATGPERGFSLPMAKWLAGPLAPLVTTASEPDAPVWSLVDRARAAQAGLAPLYPRLRWAETWALAVLRRRDGPLPADRVGSA